jgi:hypothetical protein
MGELPAASLFSSRDKAVTQVYGVDAVVEGLTGGSKRSSVTATLFMLSGFSRELAFSNAFYILLKVLFSGVLVRMLMSGVFQLDVCYLGESAYLNSSLSVSAQQRLLVLSSNNALVPA